MNGSNLLQKSLKQPKRIRELFTQRTFGSLYLSFSLEFLHFLLRLGLKPGTDGWRKYATAFLRTEDSRFLLASFRLKAGQAGRDDETLINLKHWVVEKLTHFFTANPQLWNTRLVWNQNGASIQPNNHLDIVWAEFDKRGKLSKMRVFLDADQGLSLDKSVQDYAETFVKAYNQTLFTGRQRPYHLMKTLRATLKNSSLEEVSIDLAQRILDSVFIRFDRIELNQKFDLPDFSDYPHPGGGAFNILCRLQSPDFDEIDLWFHINHALFDGNPVLEAINDLKKEWGKTGMMAFSQQSQTDEPCTYLHPAHNDSGREWVYAHRQISFEHLLEQRDRFNQKYQHLLKEKITIAGMILWGLSHQPFLKKEKITLVIDVPREPGRDEPRTLGFVTTTPGDFQDETDRELSFVLYQNFLNDAIARSRKRADLNYLALKSQAIMPVTSYEMTLAMVPNAIRDIGGKLSLTIMPLAEYCTPPADDTKDAVISIGNILIPSGDGKLVGAVCVKSIVKDVDHYWESIYNTITRWHI